MLSFLELAARPEFTVAAVDCRDDHRGWTAERPREDVRLVFVRRGGFRRQVRGIRADLDRTVGYLGLPGDEEYFAHPDGGDTCTSISLTPALWRTMAGDAPRLERSSLYVDGRLDLAHRRLLAATRAADTDHAATEGLIGLLATVVRQIVTTTVPDGDRTATGQPPVTGRWWPRPGARSETVIPPRRAWFPSPPCWGSRRTGSAGPSPANWEFP